MSTFTLTPSLRALIKRMFRGSQHLSLTPTGVLCDGDTVVSLAGPFALADTYAAHLKFREDIKSVLSADTVEITPEEVVVTKGSDYSVLPTITDQRGISHLPVGQAIAADAGSTPFARLDRQRQDKTSAAVGALNTARHTIRPELALLGAVNVAATDAGTMWSSTDRYRLVQFDQPGTAQDEKVSGHGEANVRGALFGEIARRKRWSLEVRQHTAAAEFSCLEGVRVVSMHIEGQYPWVSSLMQIRTATREMTVDPAAARRTIAALEAPRLAPIALTADGQAHVPAYWAPRVEVACDGAPLPFGEPCGPAGVEEPIGVDPDYMDDILRAGVEGLGQIRLQLQEPGRPLLVEYDYGWVRALLMPIRLAKKEAAAHAA